MYPLDDVGGTISTAIWKPEPGVIRMAGVMPKSIRIAPGIRKSSIVNSRSGSTAPQIDESANITGKPVNVEGAKGTGIRVLICEVKAGEPTPGHVKT